ncbi:HIRAN domain-containing protein [Niveispirillum sp.]|uniref:HIRAN domain-containing protein n=1 Tax=Niveispirillum sp. TaxID=1917217 RepID=UPI001B3FB218|nr:HIRAN domain-containing protein [Niveispirillum sp.]MBP7334931.1 HIRAN domain-containing protein [Niveispirillum sp.]
MANWIERVSEPPKLFLAWQAPDHLQYRFRWAVGIIAPHSDGLSLRYFEDGVEFEQHNQGQTYAKLLSYGYKGYPAFSTKRLLHTSGVADVLVRRLPPSTRPDFSEYKKQFRIPSEMNLPLISLLGSTEAKLPSDGFSVVDPLDSNAQYCDLMLEIAGFRYYSDTYTPTINERIEVLAEPDNRYDAGAVKICAGGKKIGNINRLQAPTFLSWINSRSIEGNIERLNGKPTSPRAFIFVRVRPAVATLAAE